MEVATIVIAMTTGAEAVDTEVEVAGIGIIIITIGTH